MTKNRNEDDSSDEGILSSSYESENESENDDDQKNVEFDKYDSSDEEDLRNTIGNIPVSWYDDADHFGYDWKGHKLGKAPNRSEIDEFLAKADDPNYWRTVKDRQTGRDVVLSDETLDTLHNIQSGRYPKIGYNPFQPFLDIFSHEVMQHPITNAPEHKRSFLPSKQEARKIGKIVHAMKMGWIKPRKPKTEDDEDEEDKPYDLWGNEEKDSKSKSELARIKMRIPAPKMVLPGHVESYNPPPEYLFTKEEEAKWKEQSEEEHKLDFLPQKFDCMRHVPQYNDFIKDRFSRCMDLYLAPRRRKERLNVEAEDLLPKLPEPKDLRPFPTTLTLTYNDHKTPVRCIAVEPQVGQFFASASDDLSLCVWELATGRRLKRIQLPTAADDETDSEATGSSTRVNSMAWCPNSKLTLLAVAAGRILYLVNIGVGDKLIVANTDVMMKSLVTTVKSNEDQIDVTWKILNDDVSNANGIRIQVSHSNEIEQVTWHAQGDYFSTVCPKAGQKSVLLHQLSKTKTQTMISKPRGTVQRVLFHPLQPCLFVATERHVRVYNLVKQQLTKKLMSNCKNIASMSIHPKGDNIIVGGYDCRLDWFDLDLSTKPYKTFGKHHTAAVSSVAFHRHFPLFASCSTDGTVVVCHGMVYSDLMQNPLIVPLKILRNSKAEVSDCAFHPVQPWILASSRDGLIRLYT